MADTPAPNSFENLTQSGLFRINSKDDKAVSLSLDAYAGSSSFCIFTGAGGRPWKLGLPRKTISNIVIILKKMMAAPQPCREAIMLNKFEETDGKKGFVSYGQIGFGIDENLTFFIDVAAKDLPGRHLFPVKQDGRFDFSNTSMSEKDLLLGTIQWIIHEFDSASSVAERITSFKRTPGNKPGFGGGKSFNQSGGGGNYNKPPAQNATFGGAPDTENDLYL